MPGRNEDGYDEQDGAETYDETNTDEREQVAEMRTFEEMADVYDVTTRQGDRDDDEAVALDADEFDEEIFDGEADPEEDDELQGRYHAAVADEDDIYEDADNPNISRFDEDALDDPDNIEGLEQVADADLVTGGEDDFTNFQSKTVNDEDLARMGYSDPDGLAS